MLCARVHTHPCLPRPIQAEQFRREFEKFWRRADLDARARVELAPYMSGVHARDARRYAEVDPEKHAFFFAPEILILAYRYRAALIAHEIGHVLVPNGTEDDADRAAHRVLAVTITYDPSWPGKGLQVLAEK